MIDTRGKFWILKNGILEVLYKNDFVKAVALAVTELGYQPKQIIAIPFDLKEDLFMQD